MITCTLNNFGSEAISFQDFQSSSFCILNGKITIDPTNPDYIEASRIEVELPSDFIMKKSAISNAILVSSRPYYHNGTVLRCWIEDNTLCIEKLSDWDKYGIITIILASGFVTRGYRGDLTNSIKSVIKTDINSRMDNYHCSIKDAWAYYTACFSEFPNENLSYGPFSLKLNGFPTDIDIDIPLLVQSSSYIIGEKGSHLTIARIQNGYINFRYERGAINIGGQGSFTNFFAVRGGYTPEDPIIGNIEMNEEDITPEKGITVSQFAFKTCAPNNLASICAEFGQIDKLKSFYLNIKEYPKAALYTMNLKFLTRSSSADYYRLSLKELLCSEGNKSMTFTLLAGWKGANDEVFCTSVLCDSL